MKTSAADCVCNICGSVNFKDYKKRKNDMCGECISVERNRIMFLALTEKHLIKSGSRVLHIAPEAGIGRAIKRTVGEGYNAVDLHPKNYPADLEPRRFDLTRDIFDLPSNYYDLIIHSHVMEHLPCDVTTVLYHLHRSLTCTGHHVICVPVIPGRYESDFGILTREERITRFGRFDHIRRFGMEDFDRHLGMIFDLNPYDPTTSHSPEELARMGIVSPIVSGQYSSNTVFIQDKSSIRLKDDSSRG